jgi:hypothetical protein
VLAHLGDVGGLAVGDGGVLYLGIHGPPFDLLRLDPNGVLTSLRLPGASLPGQTSTSETVLALDEARKRLYFAVNYTQIAMLDLTTGVEVPWAGGGGAPGPGFGDGSSATAATLGNSLRLAISPDGTLWEYDQIIARIRNISPIGIINSWTTQPAGATLSAFSGTTCAASPLFFVLPPASGASNRDFFLQFDEVGNAYLAAYYCGNSLTPNNGIIGGQPLTGILQVTPAGVITEWSRFASNTQIPSGLSRDPTGAIYWTELNTPAYIWRIDPVTRKGAVVVGTGTRATGPDFQPGSSTSTMPGYVVPLPGGRIAWVEGGVSVRVLW